MIINGAVIDHNGIIFAIIAVKEHVTRYTATTVEARRNLARFFPNMPIILMSVNHSGTPRYVGRKDIVDFLKTIRVDQIPWKKYTVY